MSSLNDKEMNESIKYVKTCLTDALRAIDKITDHSYINCKVSGDIFEARSLIIKSIEDASISQSEVEAKEAEEENARREDEQNYQEYQLQEKAEEIILIIDLLRSLERDLFDVSTNQKCLLGEALEYYFERYPLTNDEKSFFLKIAEIYQKDVLQDYA